LPKPQVEEKGLPKKRKYAGPQYGDQRLYEKYIWKCTTRASPRPERSLLTCGVDGVSMTVLRSRGQPSTNLRPHNRSCRLAASCGEQDLPRRQKAGETADQQLKTVKPWEPAEIVRFRTCSTRRGSPSQARDLRPCERGVADSGGCSGPALQLPLSPLTPGWSREAENRAARKCKETPAEAPRRPGKSNQQSTGENSSLRFSPGGAATLRGSLKIG